MLPITLWPFSAVHPRAGGEHGADPCPGNTHYGSSPRGRGTRMALSRCLRSSRFIPRGREHGAYDPANRIAYGSSPRGRGTPAVSPDRAAKIRFIPARAGNTSGSEWSHSAATVHPRAGGDTNADRDGRRNHRFIPARAGNTSRESSRTAPISGSSRAGGEHSAMRGFMSPMTGSSPRGRGTRAGRSEVLRRVRFIPARAGNTTTPRRSTTCPPVHPRAGGEHPSHKIMIRKIFFRS